MPWARSSEDQEDGTPTSKTVLVSVTPGTEVAAGLQVFPLCFGYLCCDFLRVESFRQVSPCASQTLAHSPPLKMSEGSSLENKILASQQKTRQLARGKAILLEAQEFLPSGRLLI